MLCLSLGLPDISLITTVSAQDGGEGVAVPVEVEVDVDASGTVHNGEGAESEILENEIPAQTVQCEAVSASLEECLGRGNEMDESIRQITKDLAASEAKVAALEKQKATVKKDGEERVMKLRQNLIEAAEKQITVERAARECNEAIEKVAQREKLFKGQATEKIKELEGKLSSASAMEAELTELKAVVEKLNSQLSEQTKKTLEIEKRFANQLAEEKARKEETTAELHSSRRELFAASERIRELHHGAVSTYVNGTLIWQDCAYATAYAGRVVKVGLNHAHIATAPYVGVVMAAAAPHYQRLSKEANKVLGPALKSASAMYEKHGRPVQEEIGTRLEPIGKPLSAGISRAIDMAAAALAQFAGSLQHYAELQDGKDHELRDWVADRLGRIAANPRPVVVTLCQVTCWLFVLMTMMMLVFPRRRTKPSGQKVKGKGKGREKGKRRRR